MSNVPDDWNCFWNRCEYCGTSYHASEGGCDCDGEGRANAQRPWLESSGYDWEEGTWVREVAARTHTARRDHADGKVKAGETYRVRRRRYVDDESGNSYHVTTKYVLERL